MLNYIQINQCDLHTINDDSWETLIVTKNKQKMVGDLSVKYNIDKRNIVKDFLNYLIRNRPEYITSEFLDSVENLLHSYNANDSTFVNYAVDIVFQATLQVKKK